jgi:hypothetical protein
MHVARTGGSPQITVELPQAQPPQQRPVLPAQGVLRLGTPTSTNKLDASSTPKTKMEIEK